MPGIGTHIRTNRGRRRGGGAAWNPSLPLSDETPSIWVTKRNGSYLQNAANENIADIRTAHFLSCSSFCEESGALDIGAADFTFAIWLTDTSVPDATRCAFGKQLSDGTNPDGSYGFKVGAGILYAFVKPTGGQVTVGTAVKLRTLGNCFCLGEVDQTNHTFKFFINNVQVGTTQDFTGTFPALDLKYEFVIGRGNSSDGTTYAQEWIGGMADGYIFNRLLNVTEKAALLNRDIVSGAKAHWPLLTFASTADCSGNGYSLTAISTAAYDTTIMGSKQNLNAGYDLYVKAGSKNAYIPYLDNGLTPAAASYSDFTKQESIAGNIAAHNRGNSYMVFTDAFFDRSDETIYSPYARKIYTDPEELNYYSATLPKRWFIDDISSSAFALFFNAAYDDRLFVKNDTLLTELFLYDTQKSGSDLTKIQTYINFVNNEINLVFDGDSLTAGGSVPGGQYYPNKVRLYYLARDPLLTFSSFGVGGQTIVQMLSDIATQILPLKVSSLHNIIVVWEDVNSVLNGGRTAAEQLADMINYFEQCETAGFDIRVIVTSPYPRTVAAAYPVDWSAGRLQAQKDYFDAVKNVVNPPWTGHVDLRDAPHIGGVQDQATDPTYYVADNWVHHTAAGYDIVATEVEAVLDTLL